MPGQFQSQDESEPENNRTGGEPDPASKDLVYDRDLRGGEKREIEDRKAPRVLVIHEVIREQGEEELKRPALALLWSGFAAGLSMGFSLVAMALLRSHLPDEPWRPLVTSLGYCVGFLVVILGRQQLFTENSLTPIIPLLARRNLATFLKVLRLWGIVLASNLVGAFIFAWVIGNSGVFPNEVKNAFSEIGHAAYDQDFFGTMLKGVFAGWVIALMVWMLPAVEDSKVWVIVIMTYIVALGGFAHIVVGSIETFYLVATGALEIGQYFANFFLPTVLGNIIGGASLVAFLNSNQVIADQKGKTPK
ncbi:MAG: transporter [Chloroflexi bacterium 54-19]|nr:MAG: transporter [Chloroflexi bacterium 54-19]